MKDKLVVSSPRGFWESQPASTGKACNYIPLCEKEHMIVCECVSVGSTHAQEPSTSQAQAQCSKNKDLQVERRIFPPRQVPRATEHLGREWISQEVCPLRAAAAGTVVIVKSSQGQEELGLNTRKLFAGAVLVPGASRMILANGHMASHTDGLSAVDSATHSAKAFGCLHLEKA